MQSDAVAWANFFEALRFDDGFHIICCDNADVARLLGNRQHFSGCGQLALRFTVSHSIQDHESADKTKLCNVINTVRTHAHDLVTGATLISVPADDAVVAHRTFGGIHIYVTRAIKLGLNLTNLGYH